MRAALARDVYFLRSRQKLRQKARKSVVYFNVSIFVYPELAGIPCHLVFTAPHLKGHKLQKKTRYVFESNLVKH
jgi:hypothetical protein